MITFNQFKAEPEIGPHYHKTRGEERGIDRETAYANLCKFMQIYANIVYRPTSNIQTLHLVFITKRARGKLQTLSANRAVCFIFLHLLLLFFLISLSSHPSPSPARLHRLHHRHLLLLLRLLLLEFIFLINNHSKKEKEHDKKRERERERERGRERERERRN